VVARRGARLRLDEVVVGDLERDRANPEADERDLASERAREAREARQEKLASGDGRQRRVGRWFLSRRVSVPTLSAAAAIRKAATTRAAEGFVTAHVRGTMLTC